MSKSLVIVESPAKARTINKILGPDFIVKASMGHVRDLPEKELGIDVENGFKPKYVSIKSRAKVIQELAAAARSAERVYLAPDPDREGEAIAWHLLALLKKHVPEDQFFRVTYNEITASAIRKAFREPGRIDERKVDSQQARRILDRLVGYKVSPLLWRRIRGAQSAGRVQSVALRLVCEREREILNFKPEEYWLLGARVCKRVEPTDPFEIRLARVDGEKAEIKDRARADAVRADLEGRELRVSAIIPRELSRRAPPPYITSTLQQAGSGAHGFAPAFTMKLAQKLYEGVDLGEGSVGLITYMRTDSFNVSREAQETSRAFIRERYGEEYLPERPPVFKSRESAQEAHEAIRPTDVGRTPEQMAGFLSDDEAKLYRLIWNRFVASQMAPARIAQKTVEVETAPRPDRPRNYLFRATASEVVFPGYMKVAGSEAKKKEEDGNEEVDRLPPLAVGEPLRCLEWLEQQKFTQPPGRFTEASLVRALEENGVGRPSTYAQILSTLIARRYVTREKRALQPTPVGLNVNDFLVAHLGKLFDVKFTAAMEETLDEVESGSIEWVSMLAEFHRSLLGWIENAKGPPADPAVVKRLADVLRDVREWSPPVKRGKRTYSDEAFTQSVREQAGQGKTISERQAVALRRLVLKYRDQLPDLGLEAEQLGLHDPSLHEELRRLQPPGPETLRKLELLKPVRFREPRKARGRTYDDRAFVESLRQQAEGGRGLSENQIRYLDRLLFAYADQIPGFESLKGELGLMTRAAPDAESGPLIELFKTVRQWKEPFQRGRREWDDRKFYESLARQHAERGGLSPRQVASLKKMARRYAKQIPDFEEAAVRLGIETHPRKGGPGGPEVHGG
jgi:DNA topoisomerase-1